MRCRNQSGSRDHKAVTKPIDASFDEIKRAVRPQLAFEISQIVRQCIFLCCMIGEELGAGMDAVLPGPISFSVEHTGCAEYIRCQLITSEGARALPHLAIAVFRLVGAAFGDGKTIAEFGVRGALPSAAARCRLAPR